jgi:hypothetical protein
MSAHATSGARLNSVGFVMTGDASDIANAEHPGIKQISVVRQDLMIVQYEERACPLGCIGTIGGKGGIRTHGGR